jgi:hypothetical protein
MRADPDNPVAKERVRREHFPNLPNRAFERAWAQAVKKTKAAKWSKAGPRKGKAGSRR